MRYFYKNFNSEKYYNRKTLHNESGPAIINLEKENFYAAYYINGLLHNLNGPAIILYNGYLEYFLYGQFVGANLSNEEFKQRVKETVFK